MAPFKRDSELDANLYLSSSRLQQIQPAHSLLTDIQEKSEFFDTAAAKFSAKVSS